MNGLKLQSYLLIFTYSEMFRSFCFRFVAIFNLHKGVYSISDININMYFDMIIVFSGQRYVVCFHSRYKYKIKYACCIIV